VLQIFRAGFDKLNPTGEVAALVTVPDFGLGLEQGIVHGGQHELHLQGLAERPTHHITRIPIQDCGEIQPAMLKANVGNVNAPDVIGIRCQ
jgi:hypothetical protein